MRQRSCRQLMSCGSGPRPRSAAALPALWVSLLDACDCRIKLHHSNLCMPISCYCFPHKPREGFTSPAVGLAILHLQQSGSPSTVYILHSQLAVCLGMCADA